MRVLHARLIVFIVLAAALAGCGLVGSEVITGSGLIASEARVVDEFSAVELAGSGDVNIQFGPAASLTIEADDNLLPYITSDVRGDRLVLGTRPGTNLVTANPIRYLVTIRELTAVALPGSGTITIDPLQADAVDFSLPGSGTILASGLVNAVEVALPGSGNIDLGDVQAATGEVRLGGSGNVTVWITDRLHAVLSGSGNILYYGHPALDEDVSGSGDIRGLGDK